MNVTDDEHVHDGKVLPGLVDEVIKSDNMISIGKLFADGGAYEVMIFLDICEIMESCHV